MGPRTAEARRQVAEQRHRLDRSLDAVEDEARADLRDARERVGDLADEAQDQIEALPGMNFVHGQIKQHPMTSVVAGFALGIAAGMVMDSFRGDEDDDENEERERREKKQRSARAAKRKQGRSKARRGRSQDMLRMFAGPAIGMIGEPLRHELTSMIREGISSLFGRDDDDHRPAHMAASRRDDDEDESDRRDRDRRGAA